MKKILASFVFFTRFPFWKSKESPDNLYKYAVWYWPVTGIVTGAITAFAFVVADFFNCSVAAAIILAFIVRFLITRVMNEKDFACFFDGFSGNDEKEGLNEMKNGNINGYGLFASIFYFAIVLASVCAVPEEIIPAILFTGEVFCKSLCALTVNFPHNAMPDDSSEVVFAKVPVLLIIFYFVISALSFYLFLPEKLWLSAIIPIVVFIIMLLYIRRKFGGYTKESIAALFMISEASFFLTVASVDPLLVLI